MPLILMILAKCKREWQLWKITKEKKNKITI